MSKLFTVKHITHGEKYKSATRALLADSVGKTVQELMGLTTGASGKKTGPSMEGHAASWRGGETSTPEPHMRPLRGGIPHD